MKRIGIFILLFILPFSIWANDQRIIPLESEVYPLLELITAESRQSQLSQVKPYSEAEVRNILDDVVRSGLSAAAKKALDEINTLLGMDPLYTESGFSADVSGSAAFETYLHTSDDESEWQYGYEDRLPVLSLKLETWFNDGFYAVMEPELKESRFLIDYTDAGGEYAGNITNIPGSFGDINYHFPQRGLFSFGGENWNFQVGRDQLQFGNGESGNIHISSYPDFYDFIKLKGFVDNFAFSWSYLNLENWVDDGYQRFIVDHDLGIRLFDILTLFVNESALFYGESTELQFINPLIVYHNLFRNHFNDGTGANICMSVGFNVVPYRGITLYGEYMLDEVQSGLELAEYPGATATPNSDAHMLGAKASWPIGPGYITGFFEYIYTSPWCYLLDPAGGSMVWTHLETTDVLNARINVVKPLGYEYGPDAIAFSGSIGYILPGVFDAALSADYILKGENDINTEYIETAEAAALATPTGTPMKTLIIGLSAYYDLFSFMSAGLNLDYVDIRDYKNVPGAVFTDFQTAISIIFNLSKADF